ncbi:AMP-binding protein, partial [Ruminococcus flavefaciens]|uniref:AMP-binding protein n=1 Tax=Ruminococcus flavefaciens TaxID=1265 RepID=UPI001FA801E6
MQNNETTDLKLSGSEGEITGITSTIAKFDLTFNIAEQNGKYCIYIEYCTDLFNDETADSILKHFAETVKAECEKTEEKLGNYEMLTEADRNAWKKYNETDEVIEELSLLELVRRQCEKTPYRTAVVFENESITYDELWQKAGKIAGYLHSNGYGKDDSIAVSGERSIETVVNIIGILAAGCLYVPENPEYPEERNRYIRENSKCKERLDAESYTRNQMESYSPFYCENDPESIAYTIYTSGSTGLPKGVVIKNSAAANTIQDINRKFAVNEKSCIIGLSAFSFDLSVYDIFGALSTGAKLIIVRDQRDYEEIQGILNKYEVTFWNSVPAIMSMYLMSGGMGTDSLRNVLLSGDWIPITLPSKIRSEFVNTEVCSLGGATEGSIWSIYYPIIKVPDNMSSIPYGMPLANQKMLILNENGKLCPIGAVGEICIAGKGVAECYANQEDKTRKAFVEYSEFGRVYRTGDIGRLRAEGYIEF